MENVPHPMYGDRSVPSGESIFETDILSGFWRYRSERIIPASAITADLSRQNYSVFPRRYYVDIQKHCCDCGRPFIFFAREQRYWIEELGFFVDADCGRCFECRKDMQALRECRQRYDETVGRTDLSDDELAVLIKDLVCLWEHSMIRDEQKLRRFRNVARKRIPGRAETREIESVIARLQPDKPRTN